MSEVIQQEIEDILADEKREDINQVEYVIKDLLSGSVGGFAISLAGHPFDTVKVRMQMLSQSLSRTLSSIFKEEGISGFYKGMGFPLVSVPLVNAVVFGSYEFFKRFLDSIGSFSIYQQGLFSGLFAGLVNTVVVSPVELVKCRLQMQIAKSGNPLYTGPYQCTKNILMQDGIRGLYRGGFSTASREIPCYGAQFIAYEATKGFFKQQFTTYTLWMQLIAGGVGGLFCWVASYPQDIVKTHLQCDFGPPGFKRKYQVSKIIPDGGFFDCARQIVREQGFRGLWIGFSACAIRAMYANAIGFMVYEYTRDYLINEQSEEEKNNL